MSLVFNFTKRQEGVIEIACTQTQREIRISVERRGGKVRLAIDAEQSFRIKSLIESKKAKTQ